MNQPHTHLNDTSSSSSLGSKPLDLGSNSSTDGSSHPTGDQGYDSANSSQLRDILTSPHFFNHRSTTVRQVRHTFSAYILLWWKSKASISNNSIKLKSAGKLDSSRWADRLVLWVVQWAGQTVRNMNVSEAGKVERKKKEEDMQKICKAQENFKIKLRVNRNILKIWGTGGGVGVSQVYQTIRILSIGSWRRPKVHTTLFLITAEIMIQVQTKWQERGFSFFSDFHFDVSK